MKKILVCFIITFFSCCLIKQDNTNSIRNISWTNISRETVPEQIFLIAGMPDLIYNVKSIYNEEYDASGFIINLIWINPGIDDKDTLEYGKRKNIQIGNGISNIFEEYESIELHYANILFMDFSSTMILKIKNKILIDKCFQINISDRSLSEYIANTIYNNIIKVYGPSNEVQDTKKYDIVLNKEYIWYLEEAKLVLSAQISLEENKDPKKFGIIDYIQINYEYIKNNN